MPCTSPIAVTWMFSWGANSRLVALPDIEALGRFALTKQVDAATLARLIYTSRLWRFWTVIANYGGGIAGEDEALAVLGVELTHEKSF